MPGFLLLAILKKTMRRNCPLLYRLRETKAIKKKKALAENKSDFFSRFHQSKQVEGLRVALGPIMNEIVT